MECIIKLCCALDEDICNNQSTALTISPQNKRHSCSYCDKTCAKIDRHCKHHNKDKAEVAEEFAHYEAQKILKNP